MLIEALAWGAAAGLLARYVLPGDKPGPVATLLAGLGGCLIGFLVGHEALGIHEFHLFAHETLLPAVAGTVALLLVLRPLLRSSRRQTLFF